MARDHRGPANSIDTMVRQELDDLREQINQLQNGTTSTIQQMRPADVDDPLEGEQIIDWTDNQLAWYSGGSWRKAGGLPFARLLAPLQTLATGGDPFVRYLTMQPIQLGAGFSMHPTDATKLLVQGGGFYFCQARMSGGNIPINYIRYIMARWELPTDTTVVDGSTPLDRAARLTASDTDFQNAVGRGFVWKSPGISAARLAAFQQSGSNVSVSGDLTIVKLA